MAKIERYLGTLLMDFCNRDLEYAEYDDSEGYIPSLIISKMRARMSLRVTLSSQGFSEDFIVCRESNKSTYYWFRAYSDEYYGNYPTWYDAINGLELYLMEYLDTARVWDTVIEF